MPKFKVGDKVTIDSYPEAGIQTIKSIDDHLYCYDFEEGGSWEDEGLTLVEPSKPLQANYRIKHKDVGAWEHVYVDHKTGEVTSPLGDYTYDQRLSEMEESEFWEVQPLTQQEFNKTTSHYTQGSIECVDYLWSNMPLEAFIGGLEWNIKKYLHRWRYKEKPVQDLRKARDYLTVLIETMEGKEPKFKEWKND